MLKILSKYSTVIMVVLPMLAVFINAGQAQASTLAYSGRWRAEENDNGRLLQRNDQNVSVRTSQSLSDQLMANESVRYSYSWSERDRTNEIVAPGMEFLLQNDLFGANIGALANRNLRDSPTATSNTVNAGWNSRWENEFVPKIRAYYDYHESRDNLDIHIVDNERDSFGGKVDWNLRLFSTYYSYSMTKLQQFGRVKSETDLDNQQAGILFNRAFWDRRLRVNFSQLYSENNGERRYRLDSSSYVPQFLSDVRVGTDPFPDDIDETPLVSNNAMRDGDLLTPAYTVLNNTADNSIMLTVNSQTVDVIFLYTDAVINPTALTWRVYTNNILGTLWTPVTLGPSVVTYDPLTQRFVIPVSPALNSVYIKVVLDLGLTAPVINFTEVEAVRNVTAQVGSLVTTRTEQQTDRTNANIDFRLNRALMLSYSLSSSREKQMGEEFSKQDLQSVGLHYANALRDLQANLSYSFSKRWHAPDSETEADTYLFNLSKQLLPTLTLSGDITRIEASQNGGNLRTTDSFKIYCDAQLYPDLSARLDSRYTTNNNETDVGTRESENYDSSLNVTSRLKPSLNLNMLYDYEKQLVAGETTGELNRGTAGLLWQPSDMLLVNISAGHTFYKFKPDSTTYSASTSVGIAENMELLGQYIMVDADDNISESGYLKWRWRIARYLSWQSWVEFADADNVIQQNHTKFFCELSANFSVD